MFQHQDRDTTLRAQTAADRQTIFTQHHHIEHDQVELSDLHCRVHRHGVCG